MFHPARAVHWDGAKDEEVIIQVVGMGPVGTTLVDPKGHSSLVSRSKRYPIRLRPFANRCQFAT
jgi:hypothetical protein